MAIRVNKWKVIATVDIRHLLLWLRQATGIPKKPGKTENNVATSISLTLIRLGLFATTLGI
jgi:hypothetical protein